MEQYSTSIKILEDAHRKEKRNLMQELKVAKMDMRKLKITSSKLRRSVEARIKIEDNLRGELQAVKDASNELKRQYDTGLKKHQSEKRNLTKHNNELRNTVRALMKNTATSRMRWELELKRERETYKLERDVLMTQIKDFQNELQSAKKSLEEQMKNKEKKHQEDLRFYSKEKRQLKKELEALKVANSRLKKHLDSEMKAHEEERKILRAKNQEMQEELEMLKTEAAMNNMHLDSTRSGTQGQTETIGRVDHRKLSIENFKLVRILGEGGFGKVALAKKKASDGSDQSFAMKIIKKSLLLSCCYESFAITEKEALVLASGHPFITTLYACFQTKEHLFFVMEFESGGNMAKELEKVQVFTEKRVQFYAAEITLALEFLHRQGILHRDLKLDNILIDGDGHCKLADFGLAQLGVFHGHKTDIFCGTPWYMAPELLQQLPYGHGVDWWALGIVMYAMLAGRLPFSDTDEYQLHQKIRCHEVEYPEWISLEAVLMMTKLLRKDPLLRLGTDIRLESIRGQPFFKGIEWHALLEKRIEPPHKPKIVQETKEDMTFDNLLKPDGTRCSINQEEFEGFSFVNYGVRQ